MDMTLIHTLLFIVERQSVRTLEYFCIKSRLQTATVTEDAIPWQISKKSGDKRLMLDYCYIRLMTNLNQMMRQKNEELCFSFSNLNW